MAAKYHDPVLLHTCVEGLAIKENGIYVDATFGGGGHSKAILEHLKNGKLIAFDQDKDAVQNIWDDERLLLIRQNFRYLKQYLRLHHIEQVDGILADLGISSHQIDTPERGFSTRFDAALDMRMNQSTGITAREILNQYTTAQLQDIFSRYGEIRNAKTLAAAIRSAREVRPIVTGGDLKAIIDPLVKERRQKYFAQVYQALRIEVNDEVGALCDFLNQSVEVLKPGGRLVVISYHSLEDRLVKNMIKRGNLEGEVEKDFYGRPYFPLTPVNKRPIVPDGSEISRNPRARSAKLRIAIRQAG